MNVALHTRVSFKHPLLWAVFLLYLVIAGFTLANHEMWADELHSWNIAKGSENFMDIFRNSRYEGHPPLWYIVLWTIAQFTHNLAVVQVIHLLIAAASVFLILFYSRFPTSTKLLLPFGYFLLFEYAIISRNYAMGILIACLIGVILHRNIRYKIPLYYALVLLLTNTHLVGALLAAGIHVYFLLWQLEQRKKPRLILIHVLAGMLVALPALYFIFPPADSLLNTQVAAGNSGLFRVKAFLQSPLRSMLPMPAWWKYNWWNTQFLVEAKEISAVIRLLSILIVVALPVLAFFIFRNDRKSLGLFFANLFFSFMIAMTVITLGTARYSGFIFIGFVMSLWMYCNERQLQARKKMAVNALLVIHVIAGTFAVIKEYQCPFSNSYRVGELVNEIPPGKKMVCDYWAVNTFASFVDKPVYCLDLQKEVYFVLLDSHLHKVHSKKNRYVDGMNYLRSQAPVDEVYMISTHAPEAISRIDPQLKSQYEVELIDKREGAIEKFGNIYLYSIKLRPGIQ
jgi:hypothetical protein